MSISPTANTSNSFDLPEGTVMWTPLPKPEKQRIINDVLSTKEIREPLDRLLDGLYEKGGLRLDALVIDGERIVIKHLTAVDMENYRLVRKDSGLHAEPRS
jgi:hypothetical protein